MSTFQALYDLDFKSKVASLNGKTLEIFSDLNPISPGVIKPYFRPLAIWTITFQA